MASACTQFKTAFLVMSLFLVKGANCDVPSFLSLSTFYYYYSLSKSVFIGYRVSLCSSVRDKTASNRQPASLKAVLILSYSSKNVENYTNCRSQCGLQVNKIS